MVDFIWNYVIKDVFVLNNNVNKYYIFLLNENNFDLLIFLVNIYD